MSFVVQTVNNLPAMQETLVQFLVRKIPWRSNRLLTPVFLPRESPWTEEPGRLQSMGVQKVRHVWVTSTRVRMRARTHTHTHTHTHRFWGRRFKKVKCHSHHIPSQHMSKWLTSVDVDLDHLAKVVYIRFPHWNYFFPPFYTVLFCRKSWVQGTLKKEELYFTSWGWLHWFWISYAPEIFSLLSHLSGASQGHCFSVTKA